MRFRVNLQWKVLLLVAGLMTAVILASFYLHGASVRSLVEQDHYDSAVAQTLALAAHISDHDYFSDPEGLRRWIQPIAASRPDFRQIDVYERGAGGDRLTATTAPDAPRLSVIAAQADGGEHSPLPGVSSRRVTVDGVSCWLITAAAGNPQHGGAISVLVPRGARPGLVHSLTRAFYVTLTATVAASVLLLYLLFVYFFRRPSRDIVQAMALAREGQLSARAAVRRDDELGDIARGFNELMDDLGKRDSEREELMSRISGFNDELLGRVDAAKRELRAADIALFETQQRLAYSERLAAVGQVAAELAHEIGTPLNAISGHLQLLARSHTDADTQRRLDIVNTQIAFIVQSVHSLLERTRRKPLSLRPVDLNSLVGESLRLVAPTLDSHRVEVSVTLAEGLPRVAADDESLRQVFLNLVNNSIDAMPDGGRLEITTRVTPNTGAAEIIFRDTGTGVAPDAAEQIFEPMWTTKPSGSGLGLAIARQVVNEHGGRIECDSRLEQGVEFRLTFPPAGEAEAAGVEVKADAA